MNKPNDQPLLEKLKQQPSEPVAGVQDFVEFQNLDKPDAEIDRVWADEALHRALACDEERMKTVSFEEVFGEK